MKGSDGHSLHRHHHHGRHRRTASEMEQAHQRHKDGNLALYLLAAIGCVLIGYLAGTSSSSSSSNRVEEFVSQTENGASHFIHVAQQEEEAYLHEQEEEESGGLAWEEALSLTDVRVILAIVFVLILFTIAFEQAKEHLEESVPEHMEIILEKLFGELTVLGFLSMITFMVSKTGLFEKLSEHIFEEEDELLEYVEFVHFALFFLMVFFVIQVLLMIREARDQQEHWDKIEEEIRHQRTLAANQSERDIVHALQRRPWYTLICTRIWSKHRTVLVQEEAAYKALRREFILDRGLDEPFAAKDEEKRVKETFNFGRYLGLAQVHILSHSVEVQSGTWMFFALGGVVFYFIAVLANENIEILGWIWVAIGWLLFLSNFVFVAHLMHLRNSFLPNSGVSASNERASLVASNNDNGGESATDESLPLWCTFDLQKFMERHPLLIKMTGIPNRQQAHFWFGRHGPKFYIFLLQVNLIFVGVYSGLILMEFIPFAFHKEPLHVFILYVILGVIPAVGILYNKRDLVSLMAQVTSVGTYRKDQIVRDVLLEESITQIVRTFIVIHRLRRVAKHGQPKTSGAKPSVVTFNRQETFSNFEREEVSRLFSAFDIDHSGDISKENFQALMNRLTASPHKQQQADGGQGHAAEENFDRLVESLDTDGNGVVTKDEFISWYLYNANKDDISLKERAEDLFEMFDENGSKEITLGEFKDKLEALNMDFSMDEIGAILHVLDRDRSGSVSLEEFEYLMEKYYPEELRRNLH